METRKPLTFALTVLAYVLVTFAVQGASHFAVNADHYAGLSIMRAEPILPLGVAAMLVQGSILALLFPVFTRGSRPVRDGVVFSWPLGAFLASYIALGEAGKYDVPSVASWIGVEATTAAVQYTAFGVVLGLLHRQAAEERTMRRG